jgi:hypothetical protein
VKVKGQAREDYLWEIGSGANWLSYHLATSLALQQFFLGQAASPVPSLVVYDQPSQVYFPRARKVSEEGEAVLQDEDVAAVRRAFEVIASVCRESRGGLQAIVLDHAQDDVWGGIEGLHVVENWRGRKLVPEEWLAEGPI